MFYNAPTVESQIELGDSAKHLVLAFTQFYGRLQGLPTDDITNLTSKLLVRYQPSAQHTGNYALETQVTDSSGLMFRESWFNPSSHKLLCFNEPGVADVSTWLVVPCDVLWSLYLEQPSQFQQRTLKRTTQATQKTKANLLLVSVDFYRKQATTLSKTISEYGLTNLFQ